MEQKRGLHVFRHINSLVKKDLLIEWRDRSLLFLILTTTFLLFFVFSLALDDSVGGEEGVLWIVMIIMIALMTQKHLIRETENRSWDGLFLSPVDPGVVFISKCIFYMIFLAIADILLIPLYFVFFHMTPSKFILFIFIVLIGKLGIVAVSVFMTILTMSNRVKEFLSILLQIPILIPLLIAEIQLTKYVFYPDLMDFPTIWMTLSIGFSILFTILPMLLLSLIREV